MFHIVFQNIADSRGLIYYNIHPMETKDINSPEEQDKRPDFLPNTPEIEKFGDEADEVLTQESYPELGNQSQTGAVTNNNGLDIEPEPSDDGGVIGPND